jgi:3-deoxy-D-manno-octulosonate 8-phosphate phosphatase (KDO 8-P phosphatase)
MSASIRLAVFDVDGVMTDGRIAYTDAGEEIKTFHTRDGLGLKALQRNDIAVAIITARQSSIVTRRAEELGIEHLIQGRQDKAAALESLIAGLSITGAECAYTGDDLVDWPAMRRCGFKCAPADADPWIRARADMVTERPGGHGAVREVCERILADCGLLQDWQDSFE